MSPLADEELDLAPFLLEQEETKLVSDVTTQTDAFTAQTPRQPYVPAKTGVDAGTQIEQGELFDFDVEVEPLLGVIVGKTLEQGLLEVLEEQELAALQLSRHEAHLADEAEAKAIAELERAAIERQAQAAAALAQARARARREAQAIRKVAAFAAAKQVVRVACAAAVSHLQVQGRFHNAEEEAAQAWMDKVLLPAALQRLQRHEVADRIVSGVVASACAAHRGAQAAHKAALAAAAEAEAAAVRMKELRRKYFLKVTVHPPRDLLADRTLQARLAAAAIGADPDDVDSVPSDAEEGEDEEGAPSTRPVPAVIGPFPIARIDTVADVTQRIHDAADALLLRAIKAARVAAGLEEEPEEEDEAAGEEEEEPLPQGSILWMRHTRLQLTFQGQPLPPTANLNDYSPEELLAGLGVETFVAAAAAGGVQP